MLQSLCLWRTYSFTSSSCPWFFFFIILLYIFSEQDIQRLKKYLMMYVALKIQVPGIKKGNLRNL